MCGILVNTNILTLVLRIHIFLKLLYKLCNKKVYIDVKGTVRLLFLLLVNKNQINYFLW